MLESGTRYNVNTSVSAYFGFIRTPPEEIRWMDDRQHKLYFDRQILPVPGGPTNMSDWQTLFEWGNRGSLKVSVMDMVYRVESSSCRKGMETLK